MTSRRSLILRLILNLPDAYYDIHIYSINSPCLRRLLFPSSASLSRTSKRLLSIALPFHNASVTKPSPRKSHPVRAYPIEGPSLLSKYFLTRLLMRRVSLRIGEATRNHPRHAPSWQAWALMAGTWPGVPAPDPCSDGRLDLDIQTSQSLNPNENSPASPFPRCT